MTALKEQWQQAREQRQAELHQRREQLMQQLAEITAKRQEQAVATANDLQNYVADLQSEVIQTRFKNQQDLAELQSEALAMAADVQASLIEIRQDRQSWSVELMEKLAKEADMLHESVQDFLTETAAIRQEQAIALQAHLQSDRQARIDDVAAFRESLRTSLAALKVFREELRASVWGTSQTAQSTPEATTNEAGMTTPLAAQPVVSPKKPSPKAKAEALAALRAPLTQVEQAILDHVQASDGLKVIEIEQALLLQRLQTIDALRALQQRGLIVQKERRYYAA